jgi:hypothetical protein
MDEAQTRRARCRHPPELQSVFGEDARICMKCYALLTNEGQFPARSRTRREQRRRL